MLRRTLTLSSVALSLLALAVMARASEPDGDSADLFSHDGAKNIREEAHFGIINGKITSGIPYRNAFAIQGLWAPPYVSSDFSLQITVLGKPVATKQYTWHPFHVDRSGVVDGIAVDTVSMLIDGTRAGLVEVSLKNTTSKPRTIPLTINAAGTLDRSNWWEFVTSLSATPTKKVAVDRSLRLEQGNMAVVLRGSKEIRWGSSQPSGQASITLPASGTAKTYIVFAIGPATEADAACKAIADAPEKAMADSRAAYAQSVRDLFQKLPTLKSNNPALVNLYNRSLVHLLMNRWDVPEFVLRPYYGTGGVNGGCVGDYLYNFGENWEIFPLYDAEASRAHIKTFLSLDITKHFAFEPTTGKAFGPWYMVNQEKIIGLIYYHVKNAGDIAFLNETVLGKTVLEHAIANAMYGDDPQKPVALIDYGPSGSHLELRRGIPYNHVMPDLNGRRYNNYIFAADLADMASKPQPMLRQRAEELKTLLKKRLWNKDAQWFNFENDKGKKDLRYTLQVFKLFGSKVLDREEEAGLLSHMLNEKEFLSDFGLHSLSKTDPAYDPADVDNGGPGACTSFPPQIAERLHKAGNPAAAEQIWKRILWWGDRMPYWGDSIVADKIDYRRDTPLQCMFDGAAIAQGMIFGMFGARVEPNGDIVINPQPPTFARQIALTGLRLRGHTLTIVVDGDRYEVREGANKVVAPIGKPVLVRGKELLQASANGKVSF